MRCEIYLVYGKKKRKNQQKKQDVSDKLYHFFYLGISKEHEVLYKLHIIYWNDV